MTNKLRHIFSGVYKRYVLSFTFVVMVIIIAMGVYLYNYYYRTIYNDFIASNEDYLAAVAVRHENDLALISNMAVQFGISDTIMPFRLEEQPAKSLSIQKQIKSYQVISQFYHQLYLIFNRDDYLYNDVTSINLDRFLREGLLTDQYPSSEIYRRMRMPGDMSVLKEQSVSGNFMRYDKAVLYFLPITPGSKGTLLFVVAGEYYSSLLDSPPEDLRTTYILKDGQLIVSRGAMFLDEDTLLEQLVQKPGIGSFETKVGSEKYLFTVRQGENGFQYCTVQATSIFQRKIFSSQWGILLFILLLSIPTAILIMVLSKRLHRPVSAIRALLQSEEGGGNDFDIIQSGIKELVGHNIELSELVQENSSMRRSEIVRSFVRGAYPDRTVFIAEAKKAGLSLDKKYFQVVLMGSSRSLDDKPALEVLLKFFTPDGAVTGYGGELISHNQSLFVLFADHVQDIDAFLFQLYEAGKSHCESFVMASSSFYKDYGEISIAYLEANTAYDNRFLLGSSEILRFSDVASAANDTPVPSMYIDALKNALRLGDQSAMDSVINEIFRHLRSSKQSLFAFRVLYNEIIHVLIHEWNTENIEFQRIYDIFALSSCLSIQDLDSMLRGVCRILLDNKKSKASDLNSNMQQAAAYMRENYSNSNLNMNALAEHLSVSAVALSVEFKEVMGMSPSDYLTLMRIERAKELLIQTGLSVKEISGVVGYIDVSGFVRRFKKYTGQTPAQFRQNQ